MKKKNGLESISYIYGGEYPVEKKRRTADGVYYPFLSHTQSKKGRGMMAKSHLHPAVELIYCLSGGGSVWIGKEKFAFGKGALIVIPSGEVHRIEAEADGPTKYIVVQFDADIIRAPELFALEEGVMPSVFPSPVGKAGVFEPENLRGSGIPAKMREIAREYEEKSRGFAFAIRTAICSICLWLMRRWRFEAEGKTDKYLSALFDYVEQNYALEVTSKEAAGICGMSYSYFSRYFKKTVGESFSRYLCAVRIGKAEGLLADTEKSITEIALDVGFSSTSYFIACFRKYKKMSPGEFRHHTGKNL